MPGTPRKSSPAKAAKATPAKVRMDGNKAPRKAAPRKAASPATIVVPTPPPTASGYSLGIVGAGTEPLIDLPLPSGAVCQARRPGVPGLIAAGVLDSFDSLTSLVQTEHIAPNSTGPKKVTPEQAKEAGEALLKDPKKLQTGFQLIDRVVVHVVTQPRCWIDYQMLEESDEEFARRSAVESGRLAIRSVSLTDKMFITQWATGGSSDLTAFRKQFGEFVDDMDAMQSLFM